MWTRFFCSILPKKKVRQLKDAETVKFSIGINNSSDDHHSNIPDSLHYFLDYDIDAFI
jgi:hypothetical protein